MYRESSRGSTSLLEPSVKIGITGLANAGKTALFGALTGQSVEPTVYVTASGDPHVGVVQVPDERLRILSDMYRPKKTTASTVHYVDYAGLTKGDLKQNQRVFEFIKDADALVHVVRAFRDDAIPHPLGSVDPARDISAVELELIFGDLELVEKRLGSLELAKKKGMKTDPAESDVLHRCRQALEEERPLRNVQFTDRELRAVRHLQFLSMKPEAVVINIAEDELGRSGEVVRTVEAGLGERRGVELLALSAKVEMEIAQLEAEEATAFLEDLDIKEPARDRLIRTCYRNVGLISFFTVGPDEVRAWALRKGSDALTAAGKIHSDIQRGFIRAEVVAYADFMASGGNMQAAKDAGIFRLEGKTYTVQDGDIITFRFNV